MTDLDLITHISINDVVSGLYSGLLGRPAKGGEEKGYVDELARGMPLARVVELIVNSTEAQNNRAAQTIDLLSIAPTTHWAPGRGEISLASIDVMKTIAASYEWFVGRAATFKEVADRYHVIAHGGDLFSQIADIACVDNMGRQRPAAPAVGSADTRETFAAFISRVYSICLKRTISEPEIDIWFDNHLNGNSRWDIFEKIYDSEEAIAKKENVDLSKIESGLFVQLIYETMLGRGATPAEIVRQQRSLTDKQSTREEMLAGFFVHASSLAAQRPGSNQSNDPSVAHLFGRAAPVTLREWQERGREQNRPEPLGNAKFARFNFSSNQTPLVSIITSLYRGGKYIETFLENITSQTIFRKHCELLIIDADSPEGEYEVAKKFITKFPNIRYLRQDRRVGIYEAWNIGVTHALGAYCTNANLDDCRRSDSLEIQAATLDALPFVDIAYQDVLYTFDYGVDFGKIAEYGFSTKLPIVSRYNLLEFNSPHNGPMWRRRLHDDVGLFDTNYRSAGDFDFWIRCVLAGKVFFKINEPHVAYYVNPEGLSTRSDTQGAAESGRITKTFCRQMVSGALTMDDDRFAETLAPYVKTDPRRETRYAMVQAALREVSISSREA